MIKKLSVGVEIVHNGTVVWLMMIYDNTQVLMASTVEALGTVSRGVGLKTPRVRLRGFPGAGGRQEFQLGRVDMGGAAGTDDHFQRQ